MSRQWSSSMASCCSPFGLCLKASCCPCIVAGRNHHLLKEGTEEGYSCCNSWCCGWACLAMCGHWGWILQMIDRQDLREKADLEGSCCGSCMRSWCCTCCELIQTSKQLDYMRVPQQKTYANTQYASPPGMVAARM